MERVSKYEVCLPDTEAILPELAKIIDADYHSGAFAKAEDDFHDSGKEIEEWSMIGKTGITLSVLFEKYEGYYFVTICGSGSNYNKSKQLLYEAYLSQGGNPDAQEKP